MALTFPLTRGLVLPLTQALVDPLSSAEFVFDNEEAETLVAAMSVAPNDTRKTLIDDLIGSLKTAGVWAKLDALWVIAAHDSQAAALNWKTPAANTLTVGGSAPTFLTDRHYATDGSDDWLDTNFNASTAGGNYTQNSASAGYWDRMTANANNGGVGWFDGTDGITLNAKNVNSAYSIRINQASVDTTANGTSTSGIGLIAANRSASNAIQTYFNGAQVDTGTNVSTALNNATFNIGRTTAAAFRATQTAAVFFGGSLTATEHEDLYDALNAYMTAVGAA